MVSIFEEALNRIIGEHASNEIGLIDSVCQCGQCRIAREALFQAQLVRTGGDARRVERRTMLQSKASGRLRTAMGAELCFPDVQRSEMERTKCLRPGEADDWESVDVELRVIGKAEVKNVQDA